MLSQDMKKKHGRVKVSYEDPKTGFFAQEDDTIDVLNLETDQEGYSEIFIIWSGKKGFIPTEYIEIEGDTTEESIQTDSNPYLEEIQRLKDLLEEKNVEIRGLKHMSSEKPKSPLNLIDTSPNVLKNKDKVNASVPKDFTTTLKKFWRRDDNVEQAPDHSKQIEELKTQNDILQSMLHQQKLIIDKFQIRLTGCVKKEEEYEDQIDLLKQGLEKSLELNQELKKELLSLQKYHRDKMQKINVDHVKEVNVEKREKPRNLTAIPEIHIEGVTEVEESELEEVEMKKVKDVTKRFDHIYKRSSSALEIKEFLNEKSITSSFRKAVKKPKSEFEILMSHEEIYQKFLAFLKSQACEENLLFFAQIVDYKANFSKRSKLELWQMTMKIFDTFLKVGSFYELNIDQNTREGIHKLMGNHDITEDLYDHVFDHVIATMIGDSFLRFKTSKEGSKLIASFEK